MKKKLIIVLVILSIGFIIAFPLIKLSIIRDHYELYGSYIIYPENNKKGKQKPIILKPKPSYYDNKNIEITDILYYEELSQLSFGFIFNNKVDIKYDIEIVDEQENDTGILKTEGIKDYYNHSVEKLHYFLNEKLSKDKNYKIIIKDEKQDVIGYVEFVID